MSDINSRYNEKSVICNSLHREGISFHLKNKGINFGHLNILGICGQNLTKFSELKLLLTANEIRNLHIFDISETKLKSHRPTGAFLIEGFQKTFRKDNDFNGGGGLPVYTKNGINAKRREDIETNNVSCIWMEITPEKGKSFLVGNFYRLPDSKVAYNDRF